MVCMLLTAVLLLGCARAEFAPLLDAFEQDYENGRALMCTVTAEVEKLASVSDAALQAVQNQTGKLALRMTLQGGEKEASLLTLAYDGEDLLTLGSGRTKDGTQVLLGKDVYLTPDGEEDALSVLPGSRNVSLPRLDAGRQALWAGFESMYGVLAKHGHEGEMVKATTSINNVGASGRYIPYKLDEAGMNAAWQDLLPLFEKVLDAMYPNGCEEQKALLASLHFAGETEVRRIRDKEENDWGFRATGYVTPGSGAQRKVTVLAAWREDRGFDIEVKAPCVEGDDTLKWTFSGAYTLAERENILKLEGSLTRREAGVKDTASMEGTLKYTVEETGARLRGKVTCQINEDTYKWTPDLALTQDAVTGAMGVSLNGDSACTVNVSAAWTDEVTFTGENTVSLSDMERWEKEFILRDAQAQWTQALMKMLVKIPADERALITHVLRSDAWHGKEESVPVTEYSEYAPAEEELAE